MTGSWKFRLMDNFFVCLYSFSMTSRPTPHRMFGDGMDDQTRRKYQGNRETDLNDPSASFCMQQWYSTVSCPESGTDSLVWAYQIFETRMNKGSEIKTIPGEYDSRISFLLHTNDIGLIKILISIQGNSGSMVLHKMPSCSYLHTL